jgi:hypothetical protein
MGRGSMYRTGRGGGSLLDKVQFSAVVLQPWVSSTATCHDSHTR